MKKTSGILYRILILSLLIIIIVQPDIDRPFFSFIYENTLWVIIVLVGMGMFFMLFRNTNMIYFSLLSAAVLTFYLKGISNNNLMYSPENNGMYAFSVSQYSAQEYVGDRSSFLKDILNSEADVLSIGEAPPALSEFLKLKLRTAYPYIAELERIDYNSKIIFSKFEITDRDTINLAENPQLKIGLQIYYKFVNILFPYILPYDVLVNSDHTENQIEKLTEYVNNIKNEPLIVIGEFNQVYWSKEMRDFIYNTKLNNARRFVYVIADRNPYNHIFYTDHVNCIYFEDIYDHKSNRIGVSGRFELSAIKNSNKKP